MKKLFLNSLLIRSIGLSVLLATTFFLVACESVPSAIHADSSKKVQAAVLRYDTVHHPEISNAGMVSSQNLLASKVGQKILEQGGNAIDSAIAMGFALAVTLPRAGNIGGSGFMIIKLHDAEEPIALDFRSMAPQAADIDDFRDQDGEIDAFGLAFGPKAPGVPGTVAGLYKAWQLHGSKPWESLLEPAITLARQGIVVSNDLAFALAEAKPVMSAYPSSLQAYMNADGTVPQAGSLLVQEDLAWSLEQIAKSGADAFYRGDIAKKIGAFMSSNGGYISTDDLAAYEAKQRKPISTEFYGHEVVTMPPVSGGGLALLQILNVVQELNIHNHPAGSAASLHLLAETMKRVAANRRIGIGDPDFVDVPIEQMMSREGAKIIASQISTDSVMPVTEIQPMQREAYESRETTHYSVVDKLGNAVATTYTLGYSFGSGLVIPSTGILMDNQLKNFSHKSPEHANSMQPGKRMMSTMTPTIVLDEGGNVLLVTGSPGGGRIPNIVSQVVLNTVVYKMNLAEATHASRIHQQWRTPQLGVEDGVSIDTVRLLENLGHQVQRQQTMGSTQSVQVHGEYLHGSADPRRPGAAALGVNIESP